MADGVEGGGVWRFGFVLARSTEAWPVLCDLAGGNWGIEAMSKRTFFPNSLFLLSVELVQCCYFAGCR